MNRVRQAGAIAVRLSDEHPEVLLVRAKQDPSVWIFPKGHLEAGETVAEAAERELKEEAGVEGEVIAEAGALRFESGDEPVEVEYQVIRATGEVAPDELRARRWCRYDEALELVSFEDARQLLRTVWPTVKKLLT